MLWVIGGNIMHKGIDNWDIKLNLQKDSFILPDKTDIDAFYKKYGEYHKTLENPYYTEHYALGGVVEADETYKKDHNEYANKFCNYDEGLRIMFVGTEADGGNNGRILQNNTSSNIWMSDVLSQNVRAKGNRSRIPYVSAFYIYLLEQYIQECAEEAVKNWYALDIEKKCSYGFGCVFTNLKKYPGKVRLEHKAYDEYMTDKAQKLFDEEVELYNPHIVIFYNSVWSTNYKNRPTEFIDNTAICGFRDDKRIYLNLWHPAYIKSYAKLADKFYEVLQKVLQC